MEIYIMISYRFYSEHLNMVSDVVLRHRKRVSFVFLPPLDGPQPSKMHQVTVPVLKNAECESMYIRAGSYESIPRTFICAGYAEGKRDACEVFKSDHSKFISIFIQLGPMCKFLLFP